MKTTDTLLLKPIQKQTTFSAISKPTVAKSARPMKSMVKVKSFRPQRMELRGGLRKKSLKS